MFTYKQERNLRHAQKAIKHVRSKLIYGSNTEKDSKLPSWEPNRLSILRNEVKCHAITYATSHNGKVDFQEMSEINKKALKKYGFGACGEQAQAAFVFLKKRGIYPLDFCITTGGGHNLVVIGREATSNPDDISTWGENAVVCDPWAEKVYLLSEFEEMRQQKNDVRYADICYQFDNPPPPYLSGTLNSQFREEIPLSKLNQGNKHAQISNPLNLSIFERSTLIESEKTSLIEDDTESKKTCCIPPYTLF